METFSKDFSFNFDYFVSDIGLRAGALSFLIPPFSPFPPNAT